MPVTVKTFATPAEAAAALSSDRGARYLGGGTLVMRALNEGDVSITTLVRASDRGLAQIRFSGARATIGAEVTLREILRRARAFLSSSGCALDRRAGGANMGTVGGNLFAPSPFGDFTVALLALDATVSVQGGFGARDMNLAEFLAGRDRAAGALVLGVSFQRPANAEAFRYRKIARIKPKGGLYRHDRGACPQPGRTRVGRAHRLRRDGADAGPRQGGGTRAGRAAARRGGRRCGGRGGGRRDVAGDRRDRQRLVSA